MKKVFFPFLLTGLLVAFMSQIVFAGGIDNKQNFSARYIGSTSRNAAIDGADVAAYNPAGIMMQENGLAIELDVQYIIKEYDQTYDHLITGESMTNGDDDPAIVPTFFATYKRDKWGLYATFTINGGGGLVDYTDGNAASHAIGVGSLGAAVLAGFTAENDEISVESIYYTFTTGGTFAFNEKIAAGLGVRYVTTTKEVRAGGDYYFMGSPAGHPLTTETSLVAGYDQEATGYGFVLSFDYKPIESLNLALRYESAVALEWDTDYTNNTNVIGGIALANSGKIDGQDEDRDLPAVLGFGVSWDVLEKLNLSSSFTYYFEEQADWDGQEDELDHNSYDIAFGLVYSITPKFRVSTGYMYTNTGMDPDDYSLTELMSPPLDCHTFAIGTGYDFNKKLSLEFGAMANNYVDDKGTFQVLDVEYEKQAYNISLGLQWRPF